MTDSIRLFRAGIKDGKPSPGAIGVAPEWFFKCTGHDVLPCGATIDAPSYGLSIAEEAELGGVYLIAGDGTPRRLGFVLANDVSDHAFERQNYMYIAASKLRPCPIGPELVIGDLPDEITGSIRIVRKGAAHWQGAFNSGQGNMSHSIANLEYHHFKNGAARRPGDVHIHLFGCDATSGQDRIVMQNGDVMEIDVPTMGRPLRNVVRLATTAPPTVVAL